MSDTQKDLVDSLRNAGDILTKEIPPGVVDPRLWLAKHNPKLLEDPDVAFGLAFLTKTIEKNVRSVKRRSTRKSYDLTLTREEKHFFGELLDVAVDYLYSNFHINIAKGLKREYFEYSYYRLDLYLKTNDLVVIRKAILEQLEQLTDVVIWQESDRVEELKKITTILNKEMPVHISTYWSDITEDGMCGELQIEKRTENITLIKTYNKKEAAELLIRLAEVTKTLLEEQK